MRDIDILFLSIILSLSVSLCNYLYIWLRA